MASRREEARQNGSCYSQPGAYIAIEAIEVGEATMVENEPEIEWHRDLVAKNRALTKELEAANTAGGEVFPETQAEIDWLKAQTEQSELIVGANEKQLETPHKAAVDVTKTAHDRAITILREFEEAQAELKGKPVILSDGKAGTVEKVKLDELHGLRVSLAGHGGDWPISTVRYTDDV
jgi:hypothetical protein